jgi:protein-disulfide isomerase
MATKRADTGKSRKQSTVKAAKQSTANRAFYMLVGAIAIAGIAALTYASTHSSSQLVVNQVDTTLPPVQSEGYVMGSPSAPLEVIEFGDFECPICGQFNTLTEPQIRTRLVQPGIIRYRYIDFPLSMHRNTWNASRAAACANEQGKFWEFHDALFQTQDKWNGEATTNPDKVFKQLAEQLRLNTDQFDDCVDSKKYQAKIQAHLKLAEDRKLDGTPTFIIGDKSVTAGLSYDQFKAMVDSALAAQRQDSANAKPTPAAPAGATTP